MAVSEPELDDGDGLKPESGWVDMIQGDKFTIPFWWTGGNDPSESRIIHFRIVAGTGGLIRGVVDGENEKGVCAKVWS